LKKKEEKEEERERVVLLFFGRKSVTCRAEVVATEVRL